MEKLETDVAVPAANRCAASCKQNSTRERCRRTHIGVLLVSVYYTDSDRPTDRVTAGGAGRETKGGEGRVQ